MSDLRFNSIAGAALASVLGVLALKSGADALFAPDWPDKAGYAPEVAASGGRGTGPAPEQPPDFGRLFADPAQLAQLVARGERVSGVCRSCHTFDAGGVNGVGPALHDVFGRRAASHAGFDFSPAMQAHAVAWTYDTLNDYLRAPAQVVRGTRMAFAGVRNTDDRVALIAYLRSLSPNPPPLPAPLPDAPAPQADAAAAAPPATPPT